MPDMGPDARELERLYAYPDVDRPWVRTNFVASVDGSAAGDDGTSGPLGSDIDHQVFHLLRSLSDVVVVGAGTARAEGYRPIAADDVDGDLRRRLGLSPRPVLAVVSRRLDVPESLRGEGHLVVTAADADPSALAELRTSTDVIASGDGEIDWSSVVAELGRRGLSRVLCEGGPALHADLVVADLVDDVCLTVAPTLTAGDAPRITRGVDAVDRPLQIAHALPVGDVLLTRWTRDRT